MKPGEKPHRSPRLSKTEKETAEVVAYLAAMNHPFRAEIDAVRGIIRQAHPDIRERIKWNAPSFYASADMVTFHVRPTDRVHLVFHHPEVVNIDSPLLEGDYKDRRMVYFLNMEAIEAGKEELERIMRVLVEAG